MGHAATQWQEHHSICVRMSRGERNQSGHTLTVHRGHRLQPADVVHHDRIRQQDPTTKKHLKPWFVYVSDSARVVFASKPVPTSASRAFLNPGRVTGTRICALCRCSGHSVTTRKHSNTSLPHTCASTSDQTVTWYTRIGSFAHVTHRTLPTVTPRKNGEHPGATRCVWNQTTGLPAYL